MAEDTSYSSKILGGQNPLEYVLCRCIQPRLKQPSPYDAGCNEEFQQAMKNYFEDNATLEEALRFYLQGITEKYPELTY
ncbi:MAG: hypothetical protein ACLVCH_06885 [Roseburia inulinivorans]